MKTRAAILEATLLWLLALHVPERGATDEYERTTATQFIEKRIESAPPPVWLEVTSEPPSWDSKAVGGMPEAPESADYYVEMNAVPGSHAPDGGLTSGARM